MTLRFGNGGFLLSQGGNPAGSAKENEFLRKTLILHDIYDI